MAKNISWLAIALACLLQLAVGTYGGYFGAGIGFVMLGMMTLLGMREIHVMNALRILLAAVINAVAVLTFIVSGAVFWGQCLVMMAGALSGGWFGAQYAQKADPRKVRWFIIALGLGLSAYFFLKARWGSLHGCLRSLLSYETAIKFFVARIAPETVRRGGKRL